MKIFLIMVAVAIGSHHLSAQNADTVRRVDLSIEYNTELQTDFRAFNWVNQLHLACEIALCQSLAFEVGTYSVAKTRAESLIDDLQGFSNIEADDNPLALSVLGLHFQHGGTELFAGVRNVNEDYFTTPVTSLFTGSSPGIFPTISVELPIANYPLAALGIHLQQQWKAWQFQSSLYNGRACDGFNKGNNPFRLKPHADGLFLIASISCEQYGSNYTLGGTYHSTQPCNAFWLNIEQRLNNRFHFLAQGSANFAAAECKHYEALGLTANLGKIMPGMLFCHAAFQDECEWSGEVTAKIQISPYTHLQPALHLIRTGTQNHCVTLLRLNYMIH